MAPIGGTVLGLALSWVLSGVIQCSSTDKSNVSTCLGESSWDTTLEPWDTQIEYVNWGRMKLDMLRIFDLNLKESQNYSINVRNSKVFGKIKRYSSN